MGQIYHITPRNVFVSFTGADKEIKNKIVKHLESKNITCLESDKDCCGDYREWSIQAPKHCALFLPIITENVKETSIMKDEYEAMKNTYESLKEQDKEDFFNRIIPITTNLEIYKKHSFGMSENVSAVTETNLPDDIGTETLEELCRKIEKLLIHMDCRKNFNPGLASEFFRGRASELEKIRKILNDFNAVFICGIGGIGKTELAKKYVEYQRENENSRLTVLHLKYDEYLGDGTISPLESIINSATEKMPIANKKEVFNNSDTLVILDNFDVENDKYLDEFLSFNCKKIITTRNKKFSNYEHTKTVEIGALSREEQYELFKAHYGYDVDKSDANNLKFILDAIDGVTIFIPIIAKQCDASGINLEGMCKRLKAEGIVAFKNAEKLETDKDRRLLEGNALEIARIIFKIADLGENYKIVLRNLSLLQFMKVNADLYKEICMGGDIQNLNALNWLIKNCWVIENRGTTSPMDKTFELHPIINDLVREDLKPNPENCKEVFEYANKFALEKELFYEKNNVILANHELLFDESEKTEWLEAFLNNLDLTVESNYGYTTSYLDKIGYNRELIMKLKAILLNKEKYSNSDFEAFCYCVRESKEISSDEQFVKLVVCKAIESLDCTESLQETLNILNNIEGFVRIAQVVQAGEKGYDLRKKYEKPNHIEEADWAEKIGKSDCFHDALMWVIPGEALAGFYTYNVCDVLFEKFLQPDMRDEEIIDVVKELEIVEWAKNNFELSYVWAADIIKAFIRRYAKCRFNVLSQDKCRGLVEKSISYDYELFCYRTDDLIYALSHYMSGNHKDFEIHLTKYLNLVTTDQEALLDFCADLKKTLCQDYKVSLELLLTPISNHIEYIEKNLTEHSDYVMICEKWYEWAIELASNTGNSDMEISYSEKLKASKENRKGYKLK